MTVSTYLTIRQVLSLIIIGVDVMDHPPMVHFESEIGPSTDSERSMAQVAEWFTTCCKEHTICKPESSQPPFVPSRLVEILGSSESTLSIRLRERSTLPLGAQYATLSHCWGSVMPFKLKSDLVKSCLEGIPMNQISRVFRDAILVAWRLGIQLIWIDSLCTVQHLSPTWSSRLTVLGIVQDSLEDWTSESAQMGSVYRHCALNIAATGFLFVQRDPNLLTPISFTINDHSRGDNTEGGKHEQPGLRSGNYYLADTAVWQNGVDDSPLCRRGWVTQERALSTRTVHFGEEQIFWECLCRNASEVLPKGMMAGTRIIDPKIFLASETAKNEERVKELESLRKEILEFRKAEDDTRKLKA